MTQMGLFSKVINHDTFMIIPWGLSEEDNMSHQKMMREQRKMSDGDARRFLAEGRLGRLAVCDGNGPYIVPLNYFFDENKNEIIIHCAKKGRKIDAINANDRVCFEVDEMKELVSGPMPCEFDVVYRSVIVEGRATLVKDDNEKAEDLNKIFRKYAPGSSMCVSPEMAKGTLTVRISIDNLMGKQGAQTGNIPYPLP